MRIDLPYDNEHLDFARRMQYPGKQGAIERDAARRGVILFKTTRCLNGGGLVYVLDDGDELVVAHPGMHDEVYEKAEVL